MGWLNAGPLCFFRLSICDNSMLLLVCNNNSLSEETDQTY